MLGKLLQGRYQVIQLLSAGGFCQIYLAKDTCKLGHPICVVKRLLPINYQPQSLQNLKQLFTKEAESLKKLDGCDLVPQLLDCFEENFEFFLVQDFIEGRPLSTELQRGFHWSESFVIQLLQEVLEILEVVHFHGLIHGDVKPSNLLRRRSDDRLVLIDFGSVKQVLSAVVTSPANTNSTSTGISPTTAVGTLGYMPAEQLRGFPRPNSDIYALGAIAIQALTGLHPRQLGESDTGEIIWQDRANVSAGLASVLNKMVRYHFKDRYQSATEVLKALKTLTILYQPTQQLRFSPAKATIAEKIIPPPLLFVEPDRKDFIESDRSDIQGKISEEPTPANKSILLMGVGIGVASVLTLTASIFYFMRSPAPTSEVPPSPVFTGTRNTALSL